MIDNTTIQQAIALLLPEAQQILCELIRCPSTPGKEQEVMTYFNMQFDRLGVQVERCMMSDTLRDDPDYSSPIGQISYKDRFNLCVTRKGHGDGKILLLNTHLDVVPESEDMVDPWGGHVRDGKIFGRGACDAKGQAATIWLVLRTLDMLKVRLGGDIIAHLVVEEENGGNGSLAMTRRGAKADACIVLEPSSGKMFTSIRGAVWFRIVFKGKAGHSGQAGQTRSALLMARDAMAILEKYHAQLLAASRGVALFDKYPNPMPITFGHLEAGNWPAAAPSRAVLEGVLGLLPGKARDHVCAEMHQALLQGLGPEARDNFELTFTYRHDSSVIDQNHELPQVLYKAANAVGANVEIDAMTASCDAWLYNNQLHIPTLVYGPGTLKVAHSKDEHIEINDIKTAAEVLVRFIADYCGVA